MSKENKSKAQIIGGACCGILILLCVVIYLILGITINFWHPGWLLPVCGAIACGIIEIVTDMVSNLKQLKEKDKKNEEK